MRLALKRQTANVENGGKTTITWLFLSFAFAINTYFSKSNGGYVNETVYTLMYYLKEAELRNRVFLGAK